MKITILKTAIVLVAVITIGLAAGNPLFAQDQETFGLITAADLAFIQLAPQENVTEAASLNRERNTSLISAADAVFISRPFSAATGRQSLNSAPEKVGLVTVADYRFITGGAVADVFAAYNDLSDSLTGGLAE